MISVLGKGSFGKVLLVEHKQTRQAYAMKVIKKCNIKKMNQIEHTITERKVLERVQHPFIVRLRFAFKDRECLYFVLDYCNGGELFFYIQHLRKIKLEYARFYVANLVLALKYLHENNIIYRE